MKAVNLEPPRNADDPADEVIDDALEVVVFVANALPAKDDDVINSEELLPLAPPSAKDADDPLGDDRRGCEKAPAPPLKGCSKDDEEDEDEEVEEEMCVDEGVGR